MAIFPNSIKEIDCYIIRCSNALSLCNLQQVNKFANELISKDNYNKFREIFESNHPDLCSEENFPFSFLCTLRPDICWKFASCALEVKNVEDFVSRCLTDQFLFAGFPYLCSSWALEKSTLEERRLEICGSRYKDPDSPIHKAWKLSTASKLKIREITSHFESALEKIHTAPEVEILKDHVFKFLSQQQSFSEKEVLDPCITQLRLLGLLKSEHLPEYRNILKSYMEQYLGLNKQSLEAEENYKNLEAERQSIENRIPQLSIFIEKHQDICGFLEAQKRQLEEKLEEIRGTGPYDHNSKIHEAWTGVDSLDIPLKVGFSPKMLASPGTFATPRTFGSPQTLATPGSFDSPATPFSFASPQPLDSADSLATPHSREDRMHFGTYISPSMNVVIYKLLEEERIEIEAELEKTINELTRFQSLQMGIDLQLEEPSPHLNPYREELVESLIRAKKAKNGDESDINS